VQRRIKGGIGRSETPKVGVEDALERERDGEFAVMNLGQLLEKLCP